MNAEPQYSSMAVEVASVGVEFGNAATTPCSAGVPGAWMVTGVPTGKHARHLAGREMANMLEHSRQRDAKQLEHLMRCYCVWGASLYPRTRVGDHYLRGRFKPDRPVQPCITARSTQHNSNSTQHPRSTNRIFLRRGRFKSDRPVQPCTNARSTQHNRSRPSTDNDMRYHPSFQHRRPWQPIALQSVVAEKTSLASRASHSPIVSELRRGETRWRPMKQGGGV